MLLVHSEQQQKDLENGTWVWLRIPGVTPDIWVETESLSQDNSATYGYEKVLSHFPRLFPLLLLFTGIFSAWIMEKS